MCNPRMTRRGDDGDLRTDVLFFDSDAEEPRSAALETARTRICRLWVAVFQLEPGNVTVHPMAFTFPTRDIERVFFPTVHLHDGTFHAKADFDHALYYQHPRVVREGGRFEGDESSHEVPRKDYEGIVDKARPVLRRTVRGKLANVDTWIETGRPIVVSAG